MADPVVTEDPKEVTEEAPVAETVTEEPVADTSLAPEDPAFVDPAVSADAEEEVVNDELLEMSDDDFAKQEETLIEEEYNSSSDNAAAEKAEDTKKDTSDDPEPKEPQTAGSDAPAKTADAAVTVADADPAATKEGAPSNVAEPSKVAQEPAKQEPVKAPGGFADPLTASDADMAAAYKEIFKPFKANGKTIQPRNAAEAVRLMQMGSGYTRAMMDLKPSMVLVKTLKNNDIGAEDLNYLIDLKRGNPDAIKKLVRDAGIDPFDIDTTDVGKAADAKYRPKDYGATETQVNFELALQDVGSFPGGREVLTSVRDEWDVASRDRVFNDPSILSVLAEQKETGIYDQITAQIDHEITLGKLKNVPFLDAYHQVGQIMASNNLFTVPEVEAPADPNPATEPKLNESKLVTAQEPTVLEVKADIPKTADNDAAAAAIAPVKNGASGGKAPVKNPLNMSDADFEALEGLEHLA